VVLVGTRSAMPMAVPPPHHTPAKVSHEEKAKRGQHANQKH